MLALVACASPPAHTDLRVGPAGATVTVDAPHEIAISSDDIVELAVTADPGVRATLDGVEGAWFRPRPLPAPALLVLSGDGRATITALDRGAPVPPARIDRSLVWTDAALLDDRSVVGLGKILGRIAAGGHGGVLLDAWLRRFATTAHSERAVPAEFADAVAAAQGDPSGWDLDALPFVVTGVHNRLDLAARDGGCGQLRVSMASTDPMLSPFHAIFLFRQPPGADDVAPDGTIHCLGTARRWARLAALDDDAWRAAARAWLDEALVGGRFIMAETVELTVSPWEWRQWAPGISSEPLDNPPLFQTVDVERLDAAGPLRDDFLAFVAAKTAALDARTLEIPERFRSPSARVPPAGARPRLDLASPSLAAHIELMGCPACHTDDANFVQTAVDRTFSNFYQRELVARATRLDLMNAGAPVPEPPFGPLQAVP